MIGRAVEPLPAIAPSTHLSPPSASNFSARTLTAAASPPDVHQCVTSRLAAEAEPVIVNVVIARQIDAASIFALSGNIPYPPKSETLQIWYPNRPCLQVP